MLTIYGADLSSPSNKVRYVANALGIEYNYVRVSIKNGDNRKGDFLRKNPFGKIPVIDDEGFVLFESDAICKYLADKLHSDLYPQDLKRRAIVDQWLCFCSTHIFIAAGKVLFNRVFAPILELPVDQGAIKEGMDLLNKYLPVLEQQLSTRAFLAGPQMTIADIGLLSHLDATRLAGIDLDNYPHILGWKKDLNQKNFYTQCHRAYGEALERILSKKK